MRSLAALVLLTGFGLFVTPSAQAQSTVTGTFTLNANVFVHISIPAGDEVFCEVTLTVAGDGSSSNTEDVIVPATLKSGGTYQCSPQIHYNWTLSTPGADFMTVIWTVGIGPTTFTGKDQFARLGTHTLPTITGVPTTGSSWSRSAQAAL